MNIAVSPYGVTKSDAPVDLYKLINASGAEVGITNFGATVTSIKVPDRSGRIDDIALGYDSVAAYEDGTSFFGAVVGRFGNRIAHGRFTLDGTTHQLPLNDKRHSLHGGSIGFGKRVWTAEAFTAQEGSGVALTYLSPDGEEGYPGTLTAEVRYLLDDTNSLIIDYRLTTDAPTIANLTNHTYFNLAGEGSASILDHEVRIAARRFTVGDETLIPTGETMDVEGTPMDFRQPVRIGERIDESFAPLVHAGGYDHNYVLDGDGFRSVAEVCEPSSGRVLEVLTTEPGMQFYTGNSLRNVRGKNGHVYARQSGFCLETQHFPDSPNHAHFPSTVLRPGEVFTSRTAYRFTTR